MSKITLTCFRDHKTGYVDPIYKLIFSSLLPQSITIINMGINTASKNIKPQYIHDSKHRY